MVTSTLNQYKMNVEDEFVGIPEMTVNKFSPTAIHGEIFLSSDLGVGSLSFARKI